MNEKQITDNSTTKVWKHMVRVYHQHTDAMAIVHHAKYLWFFEQARAEVLRDIGIRVPDSLSQHNVQFAVANINIKYKQPAVLDDLLTIETSIIGMDKVSLSFEQKSIIASEEKLCTTAIIRVVVLDKDKKLTSVPLHIKQGLLDA